MKLATFKIELIIDQEDRYTNGPSDMNWSHIPSANNMLTDLWSGTQMA